MAAASLGSGSRPKGAVIGVHSDGAAARLRQDDVDREEREVRCLTTPGAKGRGGHELFDGPDDPAWPEDRDAVAHAVLDPWARADSESLAANGPEDQPASTWNYRVVQSSDGAEYFIAEVYYDGEALSWVDGTGDCLRWDRFDDLKSTVGLLQQAFEKPVLRVTGDGQLIEVPPT